MYKNAIVHDKQNNADINRNGKGMSIDEIQDILKKKTKKCKKDPLEDKKRMLYDSMNNSLYPFLNYWKQFGMLNNASIYKIIDKIADNVSMEEIDESQFNNEETEE